MIALRFTCDAGGCALRDGQVGVQLMTGVHGLAGCVFPVPVDAVEVVP